jgi:histone deacetylase 1/2
MWQHRLGHASTPVVRQVLNHHKLAFILDPNKNMVCDACQMGKSHQLPYPRSTSMSTRPLELVFSNVWGPAPSSVGRHSYYVSFLDDFSKFTWIYFIHHKCFQEFQQLVER